MRIGTMGVVGLGVLVAVVVMGAAAGAGWEVGAGAASQPVSVLEQLTVEQGAVVGRGAEGMRIASKTARDRAKVFTRGEFRGPLVITAVVRSTASVRLFFAEGHVILNWEKDAKDLRYVPPKGGREVGAAGKGALAAGAFATVAWVVEEKVGRVLVDGVERAKFDGAGAGVSGTIGVGTFGGGTIELKSLTVGPVGTALTPFGVPATVTETKPGLLEVTVPTAPPAGAKAPVGSATTAPAGGGGGGDPIERAAYQGKAKRLERSVTSVTAMMVRVSEDGQARGVISDIIGTVSAPSRGGRTAGIGFYRPDADAKMRTAFEEAVRAVTLRYPYWEPGRIEVSFGEKFVSHGGPSAGAAFAVLMLSTLEGFDVDPKCALTGDITVDWRVRRVGGVTAKLRGAAVADCRYAVIPEGHEAALADMAVVHGTSALWELQVFSAGTLQEMVAVARADRGPKVARAIEMFDGLRAGLVKDEKRAMASDQTKETLRKVLELAPNHLSAKHLLAACEKGAPKVLSANGTLYQLSVILYPYRVLAGADRAPTRDTLPVQVTAAARKRLAGLRGMTGPELQPLIADAAAYVEALDGWAGRTVSREAFVARARNLAARGATLNGDPDFMEKLVREGY